MTLTPSSFSAASLNLQQLVHCAHRRSNLQVHHEANGISIEVQPNQDIGEFNDAT